MNLTWIYVTSASRLLLFILMPRQTRESTQRTKPVLATTPSTGGVSTAAVGRPAALNSLQSLEKSAAESGTKHFRCDKCYRSFTRRENLARHANSRKAPSHLAALELPIPSVHLFPYKYKLTIVR
jgi:uncharacterized C2H2 Zn-finger protein